MLHTPTQFFWKTHPPPPHPDCCQVFLGESMELGLRIIEWSKPRMFSNESLGKIKFKAFLKGVGPRILSLEIVNYLEQVNTEW